jgi:hypothetical protein
VELVFESHALIDQVFAIERYLLEILGYFGVFR